MSLQNTHLVNLHVQFRLDGVLDGAELAAQRVALAVAVLALLDGDQHVEVGLRRSVAPASSLGLDDGVGRGTYAQYNHVILRDRQLLVHHLQHKWWCLLQVFRNKTKRSRVKCAVHPNKHKGQLFVQLSILPLYCAGSQHTMFATQATYKHGM